MPAGIFGPVLQAVKNIALGLQRKHKR